MRTHISGRVARVDARALVALTLAAATGLLILVFGEIHFRTLPERAPSPEWLTIPQRGLYTGIVILGAIGTGKTSACMYAYVEQLLQWKRQ